MNDNGEMFSDVFAENNVDNGDSQFSHQQEHNVTWVSSYQVMENKIYHIDMSRKLGEPW